MNIPEYAKAIILKDAYSVIKTKQIFIPMLILPLVFTLFLPILSLWGITDLPTDLPEVKILMANIAQKYPHISGAHLLFAYGLEQFYPGIFLMIPMLSSSLIGAISFTSERDGKTLETILYTPVTLRQLFVAKVWSTLIPAILVTVISLGIFLAVVGIGQWYVFETIVFPKWKWFVIVVFLAPAISLFGLAIVIAISARVKSAQAAQQMSGLVVLPVLMIMMVQVTGYALTSTLSLCLTAGVIAALDMAMLHWGMARLTPEKLI